jgi:peroxiredoxin
MLLETPPGELSWKAKEFSLKDPGGNSYALSEQMGKQGLLIAFICNHCPYVKAIADRFARDAKELQRNGINVLAIMSNDYHSVPSDSPENMERFSRQYGFSFPYLIDEDQAVAHAYGAVCTPDFFGFNSKGELQYRGRLDNARMGNPENRNKELVNAMLQIAIKGAGPEQQFPSMGCSIKWR